MSFGLFLELGASIFTLAGIYLGSTSLPGALCYLVALAFWFALCYVKKLWGIVPLNIGSLIVTCLNLWRLT